jgi:hypothetical protein
VKFGPTVGSDTAMLWLSPRWHGMEALSAAVDVDWPNKWEFLSALVLLAA